MNNVTARNGKSTWNAVTGTESSARRPSVGPISPGSVFFGALCCSGNSTVQFLSLLKCFLLHQASQAPFIPVTVRGQAFSSVPVWRQPGACSLHGAPQAGTLPPQCVEKGSGARVWVLSWCPSLISLASFSTYSFSSLPSFLLLKVLPRQNLFAFQGFWIVSVLHILSP